MANIITSAYFVGDLLIANCSTAPVSTELAYFIKKYEKEFLKLLLCETLYDEFVAGLGEDPVPAKWTALKNILADPEALQSPIANFIYWHYMYNKASNTVGIGQVKASAENATLVNPEQKMIRAWNEMVKWLRGDYVKLTAWYRDNTEDVYDCFRVYHTFQLKNGLNL